MTPPTPVIEMLDRSIATLWKKVERETAEVEADRRELGRLFREKKKTFGLRGDGFLAWCRGQGYSPKTVERLMRHSSSAADDDYYESIKKAEPSQRPEARKKARAEAREAQKGGHSVARDREQRGIAFKVEEIAKKRGMKPAEVVKAMEQEEIDRRREEREAERVRREQERQKGEEQVRALKEGMPLYRNQPKTKVDLAFAIITTGYHALSMKAHPDRGGHAHAQHQLTEARDWLVSILKNPTLVETMTR